jgi:hypothetical protein
VVPHLPVKSWLAAAATNRTICIRSRYWRRKACQPDSFFLSARWFGPYCCKRCCASAALKPLAGST